MNNDVIMRKKETFLPSAFNGVKGITLVEIVIACLIVSLVIAALVGSYLVIQRSWSGGSKQVIFQAQARLALSHICRNVREAKDISTAEEGDELIITRVIDDTVVGYRYDEEAKTLTYFGDWDNQSFAQELIHNLVKQPDHPIFYRVFRRVTVRFRVMDPSGLDGYQGIDITSSAYSRNM